MRPACCWRWGSWSGRYLSACRIRVRVPPGDGTVRGRHSVTSMVGIDHAFSQLCGRVGGDIAMTAGVPAGGEFALIDRLKHRLPPVAKGEVGIGDDAAVVGADGGPTLLTTDMSVSGVHADLALMG